MYKITTKILLSIIFLILGILGAIYFELINTKMIQIDFIPMNPSSLNGLNEESIVYIFKSVGFFTLMVSFSLIIIPVFIWKKDDETISKILIILLLIVLVIFEFISVINDKGVSFWSIIEAIFVAIFSGLLYAFYIIAPIIIVLFFIARKEEKYESEVTDKNLLLYIIISYLISIVLSIIVNIIWLLLAAAISFILGCVIGIILAILLAVVTLKIMSCMGTVYI